MEKNKMITILFDLLKQYSFVYKHSIAFRISLYFFIENCNDTKYVVSTLFNELNECLGECIEEVLSEEDFEEILKILA